VEGHWFGFVTELFLIIKENGNAHLELRRERSY
jgi:hypothetical protein